MSFAPSSTYFAPFGDGSIVGRFDLKENGNVFEYSKAEDRFFGEEFDMWVWVGPTVDTLQRRYAKVLKTVAYIVVDENPDGSPVTEKWEIKNHKKYEWIL